MNRVLRLLRLLVSFRGRMPRLPFWSATALSLAVFVVLFVFLESVAGRTSVIVLYPPLYLVLLALAVRRLHDCERSPVWLLVVSVPVLGLLWLFFELGLRKGTVGDNQYGPDPLTVGRDYLTVRQ